MMVSSKKIMSPFASLAIQKSNVSLALASDRGAGSLCWTVVLKDKHESGVHSENHQEIKVAFFFSPQNDQLLRFFKGRLGPILDFGHALASVSFCDCRQVARSRWSSTHSSLSWTGTVCWGRKQSSSLTLSPRRTPATLIVRVSELQ